jgi:hypothetical protein
MNYLKNYKLFESNYDVKLSHKDGKLSVTVDDQTYLYQISVDMGLIDLDVELDNIVKQSSGDFKIDGKLKGVPKKVDLSQTRVQKIINTIKTEISKTGKPPKEIFCKKEKPFQMSFTMTLS